MPAVEKNDRIRGLNIVWQGEDAPVGGIEVQSWKSPAEVDWIRHTSSLISRFVELYHAPFTPLLTFPR